MRRLEIINLKLYDLQFDRGLIVVREGKGRKDRYVPIGERAVAWLGKYLREARPQIALEPDDLTVFLTAQGEPFSRDHLTFVVRQHIVNAKLGKSGACHLIRHSMATLMHENGADIRYIQQLLGHEDIKTTQIYTHVAIRALQQVHAATHPAAIPRQKQSAAAAAAYQCRDYGTCYTALDRDPDEDHEDHVAKPHPAKYNLPVLSAAKEKETFSAFGPWCAETCISASKCEGEKPHQGVASKNPALHQGITWSNSTTALGLRGARLETRVRSRCTGKERDTESGLDNFGKRYYASSMGRFSSTDPGPYIWRDPQTLNRYTYTRNNPLRYVDPTGMCCVVAAGDPGPGQAVHFHNVEKP